MKSVRSKIIILVLGCVLLSSLAIGIMSYTNAHQVVLKDSTKIMNLLCDNRSENFNETFKRIEQSVETLTIYTKQQISQTEGILQDPQKLNVLAEHMIPTSVAAASNTESVISVYLRFAPDFGTGTSGFFYMLDDTGKYVAQATTDITQYAESDTEHVGWYYNAKEAGKPIWMPPYLNKNIQVEMISYVVPLYIDETFIGIIGMDVDFEQLKQIVANTQVYENGYAFLTDAAANIVYHEQLPMGTNLMSYNDGEFRSMAQTLLEDQTDNGALIRYTYDGTQKAATFRKLANGMRFVVTAPKSEIDEQANLLLQQMVIGALIIISITILMIFIFSKRLVRPLGELTQAAKKIADGDLSVTIAHESKDEVGVLAESFRQTVKQLAKNFEYINDLAYKDILTGAKNKTAYLDMVKNINDKITKHCATFSIIVFDLNNLKYVNDTFGHEAGDVFIIESAELINKCFKDYPLYRVGGDEFVIVMEDGTMQEGELKIQTYLSEMHMINESKTEGYQISIAQGMSHYNPLVDDNFNDVFKRADKAMYECKMLMKQKQVR